ncbi:UNVERIFIED_CONTAM: hypothetical protein FKN15_011007 [Acipenser sinensis]
MPIPKAANIPLVCELGIDKLSFDDFSLDVDAMITAALRMFMELGMVQKFKIDYETSQQTPHSQSFSNHLWMALDDERYVLKSNSDEEDKGDERTDSNDPEEIFQNIQIQKEIIANIRTRSWPMRQKLKVLKQAKEIVLKFEGRLTRTRGYQAAGAEGYLQYSVLFYGYYGKDRKIGNAGYRLPLAYFMVGMAVFAYSFIILLRKMAKNSRLSFASASDENYTFCWRVFCAWDYLIGNPEAAQSKGAAIVNNIRCFVFLLLPSTSFNMPSHRSSLGGKAVLISLRILANILVLLSLAGSIYIIYFVVDRSQKLEQEKPELTLWEKNEVSVVVSLITMIAPSAFELVAQLEMYHPRTMLQFQLARQHNGKSKLDHALSFQEMSSIPSNWSDSTAFLATIALPEEENLSTIVPDFTESRNSTMSVVFQENQTKAIIPLAFNKTALYEYNMKSQQNQCWETYVGQEMLKLSIIDMLFTVASILLIDFIRGLFVRYLSDCWCWDLESKFPEYGEFKIAENVLHLIYNQGMICGQEKIYDIISETVANDFPLWFRTVMDYVTSPVVVLPALLLLFMLIYYLQSIARSLKVTNNQLRMQLQTERTEDKKKVYQLAVSRMITHEGNDKKPDQESDITSQESSLRSSSPRRNGSVMNFESPVSRGNSIHTISQSASRSDVSRATTASQIPPVPVLQKRRMEHIPNRHPGALQGGASGACRSKSYHNVVYNPSSRFTENVHSDPLFRKSIHPVHPEAMGGGGAQGFISRRAHTTRYVIVNEHEARKKLLRSSTRILRHYRVEEPRDIVELYPKNIKRYAVRTPQRSHQPHVSEEEEEGEAAGGMRRGSLSRAHRPRSLSDLHQPALFYIGDSVGSQLAITKGLAKVRYGAYEDNCEMDWEDTASQFRSRTKIRSTEQVERHPEPHVKPKTKHKVEPSLTESDSASIASSSDQQNSSTDQYIQVIHNKEKYLKPSGKLTKKKSKTSVDLNVSGSSELICSNV